MSIDRIPWAYCFDCCCFFSLCEHVDRGRKEMRKIPLQSKRRKKESFVFTCIC